MHFSTHLEKMVHLRTLFGSVLSLRKHSLAYKVLKRTLEWLFEELQILNSSLGIFYFVSSYNMQSQAKWKQN